MFIKKINAMPTISLTSTLHPQSKQLYPSKPSSNTDLPLLCIKDHLALCWDFLTFIIETPSGSFLVSQTARIA